MHQKNNFYVYVFLDPRKGAWSGSGFQFESEPFYVGKGHGNRTKRHKYDRKSNTLKTRIIDKIEAAGLIHECLKVFDNISEEEAFDRERDLIEAIGRRDLGTGPLTNLTNGGEGASGWIPSEAELLRRREFSRGAGNPMFGKATRGFQGCMHNQETKSRLSQASKELCTVHRRTKYSYEVTIDGTIYKSLRAAAKATGLSRARIAESIKQN